MSEILNLGDKGNHFGQKRVGGFILKETRKNSIREEQFYTVHVPS